MWGGPERGGVVMSKRASTVRSCGLGSGRTRTAVLQLLPVLRTSQCGILAVVTASARKQLMRAFESSEPWDSSRTRKSVTEATTTVLRALPVRLGRHEVDVVRQHPRVVLCGMAARSLKATLSAASDSLLSLKSDSTQHAAALADLERLVASLALDPNHSLLDAFLRHQDSFHRNSECASASCRPTELTRSLQRPQRCSNGSAGSSPNNRRQEQVRDKSPCRRC